jgi:hypothetical protein
MTDVSVVGGLSLSGEFIARKALRLYDSEGNPAGAKEDVVGKLAFAVWFLRFLDRKTIFVD